MTFVPFALVEWQAAHEEHTKYSLADSGSAPASLADFTDPAVLARLAAEAQRYPEVPGHRGLREAIAARHGCHHDNVLVTVGGTEANAAVLSTLLDPGDHVVTIEPGYGQIPGHARNLGAVVRAVPLDPARGWRPDLAALETAVGQDTRLIAVTNPNNPTGIVLTGEEIDAIVAIAARSGAWLLCDEVHRGTELRTDAVTPSLWGRYDRLVCVGSMSKAFALPGLRTGWLVGPADLIAEAVRRHEYLTVSAALLPMRLAEIALSDPTAGRLIDRNRGYLRRGRRIVEEWAAAHAGLVILPPADATALAFIRYTADLPSTEVAEALRTRADVLVVPSAHFGVEGHFRVTHGLEPDYVAGALARVAATLEDLTG